MALTLADYRTKVLHRLGLPSVDAMVPNADLDESINNGLASMAADYDWPWLINDFDFVAVTGNNLVPGSYTAQRVLWVSRGTELLKLRQDQDMVRYSDRIGPPIFWSVDGIIVVLSPTPDRNYDMRLRYVGQETFLVDPTDVPLVPDRYSQLAILYASIEHCIRLTDTTKYNLLTREKDGWLKRTRDNARLQGATGRITSRQDWTM